MFLWRAVSMQSVVRLGDSASVLMMIMTAMLHQYRCKVPYYPCHRQQLLPTGVMWGVVRFTVNVCVYVAMCDRRKGVCGCGGGGGVGIWVCCRWHSPPHTSAARSDPKVVLRTKRYNVRIYMGGQGYYCSGQSQLSLHLHLVILVLKQAPVAAATSLLSTI